MSRRVLVVEDDTDLAEALEHKLERHGLEVACAFDGSEALELFASYRPDLVLLDVVLPDMSGLELCRQLRARSDTPIVILSVMASEEDRLAGLREGADAYVTKPFSPRELLARIETLLRTVEAAPAAVAEEAVAPAHGTLETGDMMIDLHTHEVMVGSRRVHLPPSQFNVLRILAEHARRVISPEMLFEGAWPVGKPDHADLAEAIAALRSEIEEDPGAPRRIVHVPSYGYKLVPGLPHLREYVSADPTGGAGVPGRGRGETDADAGVTRR